MGASATDVDVYGAQTHAYILEKGDVVDLQVINWDGNSHPCTSFAPPRLSLADSLSPSARAQVSDRASRARRLVQRPGAEPTAHGGSTEPYAS